jgi:23S rRNA (uridine2552-2'-O)-methyltransferase
MKTPKKPGIGQKSGGPSGRGSRGLSVRVKTAKTRTLSSTRWLERQLNDPYVAEAKRLGYRSRAAFKLLQLDDKLQLLRRGMRVVDLGCAPGGWVQVALERVGPQGKVVGIDVLGMAPVPGATVMQMDFLDPQAPARLKEALAGPADIVLSDMAAPTVGHTMTDHLRIMALAEVAVDFAVDVLVPGGAFVAKLFQGGAEKDLLDILKRHFAKVRHVKPAASRQDSSEVYIVATDFRKAAPDTPDLSGAEQAP